MGRLKRIGIRELKNEASRIVNEVREEEAEYLVTNRGEPVAVLRKVAKGDLEEDREAYVASVKQMLDETAEELGKLSSGESATSVVSKQRR